MKNNDTLLLLGMYHIKHRKPPFSSDSLNHETTWNEMNSEVASMIQLLNRKFPTMNVNKSNSFAEVRSNRLRYVAIMKNSWCSRSHSLVIWVVLFVHVVQLLMQDSCRRQFTVSHFLFRSQFKMTASELNCLRDIAIFVVKHYIKVWYGCTNSIECPNQGLNFLRSAFEFSKIDEVVSNEVIEKLKNHLWYLTLTKRYFSIRAFNSKSSKKWWIVWQRRLLL